MDLKFTLISFRKSVFYLFAALVLLVCPGLQQLNAQCTGLSGTYSVGPTGTYSTLTAAIAATSGGISGSVVFELQPTYTSTGETFPIVFPANTCVNSTRTLTVRPQAGATGLSITSASTTATIDLNGASFVILDGRPGGSGTASELSISNTALAGVALRFINDADSNTIRYCSLSGVNISTTGGVVLFSTTTGTNGNDWNTIDNCDLKDGASKPSNILYSAGTTTVAAQNNSNNTISNNRISNYFSAVSASAGVKLEAGSTNWTISNNKFFQTATITQTAGIQHSAIWLNNTSGNAFTVSGNTIGYASAAATGTYTFAGVSGSSLIPIYLNVGTTTATSVQGNIITAIAQSGTSEGTSSSAPFIGIYVSSGLANVGNTTGNTIGSASATGSISYTSSSASASDIMALFNFGSSNWTASNNTIGGLTASNSGTGAIGLYGINVNTTTTATSTFQNNIIGGTVANSIQNTSTATGSQVAGIFLSNSVATVSGNTIRNLTAAGGTGTNTAASVVGIDFVSTSVNNTVSQNTIFNLSNSNTTAATVVTGIQYTSSTGTNVVERNFIYGLTNASSSASAEINGIRIAGGTATYRNNMIALGNGIANAISTVGINEVSGISNVWHNSIYIGGSATEGTGNSFAFNSTVTTSTRSFRNNIFVNARSNSGATGKNYAIQVGGTAANPAGLTINNNIYFVSGTGTVFGRFNSLDVVDLAAWRIAVGQDALSAQGDPQFINPGAATPDLHLHPTNPTPAESNGFSVGVTNDFDGQTRSGLTPVDIGADAGNFVSLDFLFPSITYSPLANTSCVTSTTRTLSGVVITDNVAVNVTTGTRPRVYYKKSTDANTFAGNTSTSNGWKFVEASNTSSPFTFNIDYSLLQSAVVGTDVIQYFVVAQDQAAIPNVSINSGTFAAAPSSVALTAAAFPITGTINSYTILSAVSVTGAVTIGATGTYTSLTGATGLFNAINTGGLGGNVTASIIDASVTEAGTIALTSMATTGCASGTFSLTIKPAAATSVTLTGAVASGALIKLTGVSNVTIDGSNNGGTSRDLYIVNTATTAPTAIALSSAGAGLGVNNIIVKNTAIATGVATTIGYGIAIGGSTPGTPGADNDNITIQNDSITVAPIGIYAIGNAATSAGGNDNLNITGNIIDYNDALAGIGIRVGNSLTSSITQNRVSVESSAAARLVGISLETGFVSSTVARNNITKVLSTNAGAFGGRGITVGTGTASSNLTIVNNFINGVNGSNGSAFGTSSMGIAIGTIGSSATITTTTGGVNLYNNTVNMTGTMGTASTSAITTALFVGANASALDIRNNIFSNTQTATSTTQKNFAIYSLAANTAYTTINNNNYNVANSFNAASAIVGFLSSDRSTLANWVTASGQDALSKSANPVFVSASDLHLDNTASANWCFNGTGASIAAVTNDIDLQTRSTTPDMGADEFTPVNGTTIAPTTQTVCSGAAVTTIAPAGAASYSWTRNNTATVTGIAASGTGSITGSLTNTTSAPVTVTFTVTPLNAAGCALGTNLTSIVIVNPTPTATSTPASQTLCSGTAITTIVNTGTVTGTVFGWTRDNTVAVTGIAASGTGNISGTPTNTTALPVPVTFTITPTYTNAGTTCTGTAITNVVTVDPASSLTLTSGAGTNAQAVCASTPITTITYATIGATGATITGLPTGVTGSWAANVVTISGTPTVTGSFSYTITLTSNCGAATATGTITVTNTDVITLTSAAGTDAQTVCINSPVTPITYATAGPTGATVTGLPPGMTGTWAASVVTISGSPTAAGSFTYTVTPSGGCGTPVSTTGTVTVNPANTITLTSGAATAAQTVCVNTVITTITYTTTSATGATFTGLPAGVTGSWAGNVVTISGVPTASGVFNYTVTLTGGCGTVTATGTLTVNPSPGIALTSAAGSNAQTVCINSVLPNIVYATTGASGATFTGLPTGVTGAWAANVVTISGTPTVSGTFSYKVTLTGGPGCGGPVTASGTITVSPVNTATLSSSASSNAQTLCINNPITNITYVTTGATGATFSGLPAGVTGSWAANVATITGTPTASGTFNYTVTLTGGCGTTTATGSIVVNPNRAISLTSAAGTNAQTLCINTPITNITYSTAGVTGATFSGLPAGVTGAWAANVVTISGTPTASGTFNYTVTLTGGPGCGASVTATGTLIVNPNNTATLSSAAGTDAQTLCINTPITNITYATTSATGATFTGLPAGVTGSWTANVATITGTPTASGTFNYTVTLTGGCGAITATGSIIVISNNTIALSSAAGTDAQTLCINTPITNITYATTSATGATFTGLPAGVTGSWTGNVATISGTPTALGTFNYTVTLTGGCTIVTATGSIVVTANNTIALSSAAGTNAQTRCLNVPITNITYATTSATGATVTGLPAGVTGTMTGNVVTISGSPTATGTFSYTVTLTGGCGTTTATGTITVNPLPTISVTPATAAICIGNSVTLTASGASTYAWSPATGLSATTGASVVANPSATTTYNITGTSASGCVSTVTKLVTVNSLPTINVTPAGSVTICEGLSTTLTAFGASTYTWSPATGLSSTTGNSVSASPTVTTTYTITGTNVNGCVNSTTKTVNILPAPNASITPVGNVDICQGDTVYFSAVPGYATYTWLEYGVPYQTGPSSSSKTFTGGFYTVRVTDAAGCIGTTALPTIVTVTQKPIPAITPVGGSLVADGGFASYQWYKDGVLIPFATGSTYTPTSGGTYTVLVTDTTPLHCAGMSLPYIHTGVGVGGNNAGVADAIRLYPNPSNDIVHIEAPIQVNVLISSMEGKLLFSGKDVHEINIGAYPDGVYRVLITNKNGDYLRTDKITKMTK